MTNGSLVGGIFFRHYIWSDVMDPCFGSLASYRTLVLLVCLKFQVILSLSYPSSCKVASNLSITLISWRSKLREGAVLYWEARVWNVSVYHLAKSILYLNAHASLYNGIVIKVLDALQSTPTSAQLARMRKTLQRSRTVTP